MERCETCGCTLYHYQGFAVAADGRFLCEQCFAEEEGGAPEPEPVQSSERTPNAAHLIDAMGLLIEAPGFTPETFAAGVKKAQATGYMHMWPARKGSGAILVETANTNGAAYHVTRAACDCYGSRSHGHCYHRAAAIYASDFYGIDLCRDELLGFDANGEPITADARMRELGKVA